MNGSTGNGSVSKPYGKIFDDHQEELDEISINW